MNSNDNIEIKKFLSFKYDGTQESMDKTVLQSLFISYSLGEEYDKKFEKYKIYLRNRGWNISIENFSLEATSPNGDTLMYIINPNKPNNKPQ